jgi:hypothetical protein
LDVRPSIVSGKPVLSIRVTNRSAEAITFDIGMGPWIGPRMIQLVAIRIPSGSHIVNEEAALLDAQPGEVNLKPGASEANIVYLEEVYPELVAELRRGRRDLVLFWTFEMRLNDGRLSERVGGWLLLPKDSITKKKW